MRETWTPRGIALTALVLVAGCASPGPGGGGEEVEEQQALSAESLPGCYHFLETAGSEELGLPWGFVLEDEPLGEGWPLMARFDDVRLARTLASETRRTDHPFGYWRPLAGDSIEVGYPGGGGVTLSLARTDGELAGEGRSGGDVVRLGEQPGPRPARPVRAEPVSCPG